MPPLAHEDPFQWLQALEKIAKARAQGLPHHKTVEQLWRGVSFRVSNTYLVTPLTEIREVLTCPKTLARVPGAKSWVRGVANIRGILMPVIDLKECLGRKPLLEDNTSRMLIINQAGVSAGILVDEVLGIQHFPISNLNEKMQFSNGDEWISTFARGTYVQNTQTWTVFSTLAFSQSKLFMHAAL